MTDLRLAGLERAWKASGRVADEAAYLRELLRTKGIGQTRLEMAAEYGHVAARLVSPTEVDPLDRTQQLVRRLGKERRELDRQRAVILLLGTLKARCSGLPQAEATLADEVIALIEASGPTGVREEHGDCVAQLSARLDQFTGFRYPELQALRGLLEAWFQGFRGLSVATHVLSNACTLWPEDVRAHGGPQLGKSILASAPQLRRTT